MLYSLFFIIQALFSNTLDISGDALRLPEYHKNSYRDVYLLDVKNSLDINFRHITLKTYLEIYEPVGFDGLEEESLGLKKNALQAHQFQIDIDGDFFLFSLGRILDFEDDFLSSIDGVKLRLHYQGMSLAFLKGKLVNEQSFLGEPDFFFPFDMPALVYDIQAFQATYKWKELSFKLRYEDYHHDGDLTYQFLEGRSELSYGKFVFDTVLKYNITREDFEHQYAYVRAYGFALEYESYMPFFLNDSIFNLFVINKESRYSFYYHYKRLIDVSIFREGEGDYGMALGLRFLKYYRAKLEYLYQHYLYATLGANYQAFDVLAHYFQSQDSGVAFSSYSIRLAYKKELFPENTIRLYVDGIYNSRVHFQMQAGFLLSSSF